MRTSAHLYCALLTLSACGASEAPDETQGIAANSNCFVGDPAAEPSIELVYRAADGSVAAIETNSRVPLIQPPQGGKVMFIGVRAQNLNGCPLLMSSALIQPASRSVIALERRPVLLEPGGDGWLSPKQPMELSNYSNLPACPRASLEMRINGEPYSLQVSVEDPEGRRAEATVQIEPTCGEPERLAQCQCECASDYTLGGECSSP